MVTVLQNPSLSLRVAVSRGLTRCWAWDVVEEEPASSRLNMVEGHWKVDTWWPGLLQPQLPWWMEVPALLV